MLQQRIAGRKVACDVNNTDQYGRKVATCFSSQGEDLNQWMVSNGEALAYREFSKQYVPAEDAARKAKKVRSALCGCCFVGVRMRSQAAAAQCMHFALSLRARTNSKMRASVWQFGLFSNLSVGCHGIKA